MVETKVRRGKKMKLAVSEGECAERRCLSGKEGPVLRRTAAKEELVKAKTDGKKRRVGTSTRLNRKYFLFKARKANHLGSTGKIGGGGGEPKKVIVRRARKKKECTRDLVSPRRAGDRKAALGEKPKKKERGGSGPKQVKH